MYIQAIRGKVSDPVAMRQRFEAWVRDLGAGAEGWLGATGGTSDDGTWITVVRFASADAARRNSERPEQGEWWARTSELFEDDPTFYDCPEVDEVRGGGSDDARFVKVMIGRTKDRDRTRQLMLEFENPELRPDVIGGTTAWASDDVFVDTTYFTSEEEAREGERQEMPPAFKAVFDEYLGLVEEVEYFDLRDPLLLGP